MINWTPGTTIESAERDIIKQALKYYRGNKTATAQALKISIRTLDNKLEQYENDDRIANDRATELAAARTSFLAEQRGNIGNRKEPIWTKNEAGGSIESSDGAPSRFHVEPVAPIRAEQKMSMPERSEVQEVLPAKTSRRRASRQS